LGWYKNIIYWRENGALRISIPFTWMVDTARKFAENEKLPVVVGGPGAVLMRYKIDWATVGMDARRDVLSMFNPLATMTSRGCPNRCAFCAVPKIEGAFRELDTWSIASMICDNNFLACSMSHIVKVISSVQHFKGVDFNQGLEAARFNNHHAILFSRLKQPKIRFSFDSMAEKGAVEKAVNLCREHGLKNISVYCLIGFKDTPQEALDKLEWLRAIKVQPVPMRYQPLDATVKDSYLNESAGWTEREMRRMVRYWFRQNWLSKIPYAEFNGWNIF